MMKEDDDFPISEKEKEQQDDTYEKLNNRESDTSSDQETEFEFEFTGQDDFITKFRISHLNKQILKYAFFSVAGMFILMATWVLAKVTGSKNNSQPHSLATSPTKPSDPSTTGSLIVCPGKDEWKRPKTFDYKEFYENINRKLTDVTQFRLWENPDAIDIDYEVRKKHMTVWKAEQFSKALQSGGTIYESATGLGTNLAMTLEILNEQKGINNLKVYGNDMLESSVLKARDLIQKNNIAGSTLEQICIADSTHLFHIPSNTFDVAYSGYLDPLDDPLEFGTRKYNDQRYNELCKISSEGDNTREWEKTKLASLAQEIQDEWFGLWVSELIRITKPGGMIIIEDIAPPFCDKDTDWGGVKQDFWAERMRFFQWSISPESILIEQSHEALDKEHYHVSMRKLILL